MNLHRVETQLTSLERLVPHLTEYGCDISAQDAARSLMDAFDAASLAETDPGLARTYAGLRDKLKAISEGRSGGLTMDQVATFSRFYREQMLRAEIGATSRNKFVL